jgi:methylmalonyl-CoA mutase
MIGLNRYATHETPDVPLVRTGRQKQRQQVDRLRAFRRKHAKQSARELDALAKVVESGGNTFAQLIKTVEHCSLGQITQRLQEVVGRFRPMV